MLKFRSMYVGTKIIETSKLSDPKKNVTKVGIFLRNFSIDEIPQFFSVLKGDMSILTKTIALQADLII